MARTAEASALTRRHYALQVQIRAAALRDLLPLWSVVDPTDLRGTIDGFSRAGAVVAQSRRRDSAGLAGRYFREFRRLEGVRGTAFMSVAGTLGRAVLEDAVRSAALAGIVNARRRGLGVGAAANNGLVKVTGAVTRLVLNGGRDTLLDAVDGDRAARGWQRVLGGPSCDFCTTLATRGAVYKGEDTAGFQAHDHCTCSAEPVFD